MQNAQTFSQKTPKSRKLVHFWVTFQNLGCTSLPKLRISPGLATMTPPHTHTSTFDIIYLCSGGFGKMCSLYRLIINMALGLKNVLATPDDITGYET